MKDLIYETIEPEKISVQETRATLLGMNAERCAKATRFLIKRKITGIYLLKFILKTIAAAILIGKNSIQYFYLKISIHSRLYHSSYHNIHIVSYRSW